MPALLTKLRSFLRQSLPQRRRAARRMNGDHNRWRPTLLVLEDRLCPVAVRAGFNASALPPDVDSSVGLVSLGFTVNYFGAAATGVYVNDNGNLTFDRFLTTFT